MKRWLVLLLAGIFAITTFIFTSSSVSAYTVFNDTTCSGSFNCEIDTTTCSFPDGSNCDATEDLCDCTTTTDVESRDCVTVSSDCRVYNGGCDRTNGFAGCTFGEPAPAPYCGDGTCTEGCDICVADCGTCSTGPDPTPPPEPVDTCSGTCFSYAQTPSNCGDVGYESASGSCTDGRCCQPISGDPDGCNCCNDSGWLSSGGDTPEPGWDSCLAGYAPHWETGYYAGAAGNCSLCACSPVCPVRCGQADGCGGSCSNNDSGIPAVPTFVSPASDGEMLMINASGGVLIDWTNSAKADYYRLAIYNGTTGELLTTQTTSNSQYWLLATLPNYIVQVRAVNNTCSTQASNWSPQRPFLVGALVEGYIYTDDNAVLSAGLCTGDTGALNGDEGTLTVSGSNATGGYSDSVTATGNTYALPMTLSSSGFISLSLGIGNGDYICACPSGCSYPSGINSPQQNVNFYVLKAADAWWQVIGGSVVAQQDTGLSINNPLSFLCTLPTCNPSLILNRSGTGTAGLALVGSSASIDLDNRESGNQETPIDENDDNWLVKMNYASKQENFDYFRRIAHVGPNANSDFGTNGSEANLEEPTVDPVNEGTSAYFHQGNAVLDQPWDVAADEQYIVLVDGDVTIAEQTQVAEGGFLAIVASGSITFDGEIGHADPTDTTSVVEGIFIADDQLVVASRGAAAGGDYKFVGEGTFVGWNNVVLERDYDDNAGRRALNNENPVELFRYRPDFILNAPDDFRRPLYNWRQL